MMLGSAKTNWLGTWLSMLCIFRFGIRLFLGRRLGRLSLRLRGGYLVSCFLDLRVSSSTVGGPDHLVETSCLRFRKFLTLVCIWLVFSSVNRIVSLRLRVLRGGLPMFCSRALL